VAATADESKRPTVRLNIGDFLLPSVGRSTVSGNRSVKFGGVGESASKTSDMDDAVSTAGAESSRRVSRRQTSNKTLQHRDGKNAVDRHQRLQVISEAAGNQCDTRTPTAVDFLLLDRY